MRVVFRMRNAVLDVRLALRSLVRSPGFTVAVVLTLGLGIAASCTIFSVVNTVLLRPLPYPEADRLFQVWEANLPQGIDKFGTSPANFLDWHRQNRVFEALATYRYASFTLIGEGEPERLEAVLASGDFFRAIGLPPWLGRTFDAADDAPGADKVAVVSYSLWRRHFGADRDPVGSKINLSGEPYTVIGVMPRECALPHPEVEVWVPIAFDAEEAGRRLERRLQALGRLRAGVPVAQAAAEMNAIAARLGELHPETNTNWTVSLVPMHEEVIGEVRPVLHLFLGSVILLLLIPCANVAHLLLVRSGRRQRELAVLSALGADRWRLIRQLLTEGVILALIALGIALPFAAAGLEVLIHLEPGGLPRLQELQLDGRVIGFALAVALATAGIFSLGPAFLVTDSGLHDALREGGVKTTDAGRQQIFRKLLVVAQVALTLVLVICALLVTRSMTRLLEVDPGFDPRNLLTVALELPTTKYPEMYRHGAFYQAVVEGARALPDVESAAVSTSVPLSGLNMRVIFAIDALPPPKPGDELRAGYDAVSADYFRTYKIPLVRGRFFTSQDHEQSAAVAVINETMARRYWPDRDPIGEYITISDRGQMNPRQIVGIAGDTRHVGLDADVRAEMFVPHLQRPWFFMTLTVRTRGAPESVGGALREVIGRVDPEQALGATRTMAEVIEESVADPRFKMLLLMLFAAIALVLAIGGVYGVVSYSVSRRRRELSIRMAVGAGAGDVLGLIMKQGLVLVAAGTAVGLVLAWWATSLLSGWLYGIAATDLSTFVLAAVMVSAAAAVATFFPAWRTTRLSGTALLREE